MRLTIANRSVLIGDDAADLLISYAVLLGQQRRADRVTINVFQDEVGTPRASRATVLLNSGSVLLAESADLLADEPDNQDAEQYIRERLDDFSIDALEFSWFFDDEARPDD